MSQNYSVNSILQLVSWLLTGNTFEDDMKTGFVGRRQVEAPRRGEFGAGKNAPLEAYRPQYFAE